MLVLTRKLDEGIVIEGGITVKVLSIEDGKVKLGIEAPRSVEIHRQEIYEAIRDENKQATHVKIDAIKELKVK